MTRRSGEIFLWTLILAFLAIPAMGMYFETWGWMAAPILLAPVVLMLACWGVVLWWLSR